MENSNINWTDHTFNPWFLAEVGAWNNFRAFAEGRIGKALSPKRRLAKQTASGSESAADEDIATRRNKMANEENFKVMIAPCKECGKEFEMRIPLPIYETMVAACEEDGEPPVFTGRCPDCQERDPFLKLFKSTRVRTLGSLSRRIER